jgi:cytochrome bd-type quinol oxidase subunit 2
MNDSAKAYRLRLYYLVLNSIAIIAVLAIAVGAIISFVTSISGMGSIYSLLKWVFDSYILITVLGSIAIICIVLSNILDYLRTNNKKQLYTFIGKAAGILAILTIPSIPVISQLFCSENIYGSSCSLSELGIVFYFFAAAIIFAALSVTAFIKANKNSNT